MVAIIVLLNVGTSPSSSDCAREATGITCIPKLFSIPFINPFLPKSVFHRSSFCSFDLVVFPDCLALLPHLAFLPFSRTTREKGRCPALSTRRSMAPQPGAQRPNAAGFALGPAPRGRAAPARASRGDTRGPPVLPGHPGLDAPRSGPKAKAGDSVPGRHRGARGSGQAEAKVGRLSGRPQRHRGPRGAPAGK